MRWEIFLYYSERPSVIPRSIKVEADNETQRKCDFRKMVERNYKTRNVAASKI